MAFVVMMYQCSPSELLTGGALVHYADSLGVSRPQRVIMMLECCTGELLARAEFMHNDKQGHDALMHHAILQGLRNYIYVICISIWVLVSIV